MIYTNYKVILYRNGSKSHQLQSHKVPNKATYLANSTGIALGNALAIASPQQILSHIPLASWHQDPEVTLQSLVRVCYGI
jgi:hypothetical protein